MSRSACGGRWCDDGRPVSGGGGRRAVRCTQADLFDDADQQLVDAVSERRRHLGVLA